MLSAENFTQSVKHKDYLRWDIDKTIQFLIWTENVRPCSLIRIFAVHYMHITPDTIQMTSEDLTSPN